MSQFKHQNFLWNKDHNFNNFNNQTLTKNELEVFLDCIIEGNNSNSFQVKNRLLKVTTPITLKKEKFLIVAKNNSGEIINEALDSLELPIGDYKEINFGWAINQSFIYQKHQKEGAIGLNGASQNKDYDSIIKRNSGFGEETSQIYDCYQVQLSSFKVGNNNNQKDKELSFLSGPNMTSDQSGSNLYFLMPERTGGQHKQSQSVMNGGTNGPSLIGVAAGKTETGTMEEDNIFKYEGQEYLLPVKKGKLFRVIRKPANDLTLPDAVYEAQKTSSTLIDINDLYGSVPTSPRFFSSFSIQPLEINTGYKVSLAPIGGTPGIGFDTKTIYSAGIPLTANYFLSSFYGLFAEDRNLKDKYNDITDQNGIKPYFNYWGGPNKAKMITVTDEGVEGTNGVPSDLQKSFQYKGYFCFPPPELTPFNETTSINLSDESNLLIRDYTITHNLHEETSYNTDRHRFGISSFYVGYRKPEDGDLLKTAEKQYFHIDLVLKNFCLLPNEKTNDLFDGDAKIEKHEGKNGESQGKKEKKDGVQHNFLGYHITLSGTSYLLNKETSEFLAPSDVKDGVPSLTIQLDGSPMDIDLMATYGSGDLLTNRIVPLSCLLLFKTETEQTERPNCFSYKNEEYYLQGGYPAVLYNKTIDPSDKPDEISDIQKTSVCFFWPCMSDQTIVIGGEPAVSTSISAHTVSYGGSKQTHQLFSTIGYSGFRKLEQDSGGIAMFVRPEAEREGFNNGNFVGWYGTDQSVEFQVSSNDTSIRFTNYDLESKNIQLVSSNETKTITLPVLSQKTDNGNLQNYSLYLENKLVWNLTEDSDVDLYYDKCGKITQDNEVYCDNVLYGKGTEEGIQPYENE